MDGLGNNRDARTKVMQVSEEHPTKQDVKECATISTNIKEEIEQIQIEHDSYKAKLNAPSMSNRRGSRTIHEIVLEACGKVHYARGSYLQVWLSWSQVVRVFFQVS